MWWMGEKTATQTDIIAPTLLGAFSSEGRRGRVVGRPHDRGPSPLSQNGYTERCLIRLFCTRHKYKPSSSSALTSDKHKKRGENIISISGDRRPSRYISRPDTARSERCQKAENAHPRKEYSSAWSDRKDESPEGYHRLQSKARMSNTTQCLLPGSEQKPSTVGVRAFKDDALALQRRVAQLLANPPRVPMREPPFFHLTLPFSCPSPRSRKA